MDILDDMGVSKLSAKVFFLSELLLYLGSIRNFPFHIAFKKIIQPPGGSKERHKYKCYANVKNCSFPYIFIVF